MATTKEVVNALIETDGMSFDHEQAGSALALLATALPEDNLTNWALNNSELGNSARARVFSAMAQSFHLQTQALNNKIQDTLVNLKELLDNDTGTEISQGKIDSANEYILTQEKTLESMEGLLEICKSVFKETTQTNWNPYTPPKVDKAKQTASNAVAQSLIEKLSKAS
jgi:hypothetical protein